MQPDAVDEPLQRQQHPARHDERPQAPRGEVPQLVARVLRVRRLVLVLGELLSTCPPPHDVGHDHRRDAHQDQQRRPGGLLRDEPVDDPDEDAEHPGEDSGSGSTSSYAAASVRARMRRLGRRVVPMAPVEHRPLASGWAAATRSCARAAATSWPTPACSRPTGRPRRDLARGSTRSSSRRTAATPIVRTPKPMVDNRFGSVQPGVRRVGLDAPRHPAQPHDEQRPERPVEPDEREPEPDLADALRQAEARHLREPVVERRRRSRTGSPRPARSACAPPRSTCCSRRSPRARPRASRR